MYSSVYSSVLKTVDRQIVSLLPQAKNICLLVGILNPGGLICSNRFLKLVDWTVSNLMEPKDLEIPAGSLRLQEESLMDAC